MSSPCVAIFDIGKTNKKLLVFNQDYQIVYQKQTPFEEIPDDDGFHGDDLQLLTNWMIDSLAELLNEGRFTIKALNFSAYGASFVHVDAEGKPVTPLYNYLKTFPFELQQRFNDHYGPELEWAANTASPVLGMLNSGMQLYWLKYQKPDKFWQIEHSLHLPQYASYLFTKRAVSEITSVGCHTGLWDYKQRKYHRWVFDEAFHSLGQMVLPSFVTSPALANPDMQVGVGIHDSSAALVPYLRVFGQEPFLLISTGTWCITMNPFSKDELTIGELRQDCLSYLTYRSDAVKASRLFAGNEHERAVKHLSEYFGTELSHYQRVSFDESLLLSLRSRFRQASPEHVQLGTLQDSTFSERNLNEFTSYEEAYHQLIMDLMAQQIASVKLAKGTTDVKRIFVDGGFSRNEIYLHLLAQAFPESEVLASEIAQASALGAALVIEEAWNKEKPFDGSLFTLKKTVYTEL
ncbi:carbohydrate kinase [Siphonobacter sp. SORGH_AS_0500]|uniref:FGGY-family carbohydrate kinase n=1 Tax=Siphonobacter sp. SORGH_AS_0500 TaxID=1864824 RepID=UPI000CC88457|nr:FGGY family carbohydrate kinase [Siphonobacter sp. SORGH_AS_0500]PKK36989.1 carbohydrate kinase [Siphonobacter sp. SORGH_AS_0500]